MQLASDNISSAHWGQKNYKVTLEFPYNATLKKSQVAAYKNLGRFYRVQVQITSQGAE